MLVAFLLKLVFQQELVARRFANTSLFQTMAALSWEKTVLFGCPLDNVYVDSDVDDSSIAVSGCVTIPQIKTMRLSTACATVENTVVRLRCLVTRFSPTDASSDAQAFNIRQKW